MLSYPVLIHFTSDGRTVFCRERFEKAVLHDISKRARVRGIIRNSVIIPETAYFAVVLVKYLLQSGVNLVYIRDLLGHTSVKTTEVYARADTKMKREALINANHPQLPEKKTNWQNDIELLSWLQNLGR